MFLTGDLFPDITAGLNICDQRRELGVLGIYREHCLEEKQRLLCPALQYVNIAQFTLGQHVVRDRLYYFLELLLRL